MRWRALAATWRLSYLRITYTFASTVRIYTQCDLYECTVRTLSFYSAIFLISWLQARWTQSVSVSLGEVESSDGSPIDFAAHPIGSILPFAPYHSCAATHQVSRVILSSQYIFAD